jgi:hypothetical protein
MLLIWIALGLGLAAVLAAGVYAFLEGRTLYRGSKRLSAGLADELSRIERTTAEIEGHLAAAERSSRELDAALARLRRSRAQLNVLLSAFEAARDSAGGLVALVPRK